MIANASLWRLWNPDESIEEHKPLQSKQSYSLSPEEQKRQIASLRQDGYGSIHSLLDPQKVQRMLACVEKMIELQSPPVFCFIYDIFWQLILDLDPILRIFLNGDYRIIRNAWTWVIDGKRESAYFPPHRDVADEDFIDEEGMPTLLSVWIPLTDVSTQSSCMYVLPASWDPEYPNKVMGWRERVQKKGHKPWKVEELVNIRALPAPKGSLLCWNAGVMHWGSKPHPQAPRRISIGYYFHASHAKIQHPGLIDLSQPLSLQTRLEVIFESLRLYGKSLTRHPS